MECLFQVAQRTVNWSLVESGARVEHLPLPSLHLCLCLFQHILLEYRVCITQLRQYIMADKTLLVSMVQVSSVRLGAVKGYRASHQPKAPNLRLQKRALWDCFLRRLFQGPICFAISFTEITWRQGSSRICQSVWPQYCLNVERSAKNARRPAGQKQELVTSRCQVMHSQAKWAS